MDPVLARQVCTIEQHATGIHEFCFVKPGRQSIDIALAAMVNLLTITPPEEQLLILWDIRSGMPPISYTFQHYKALLQAHPQRASARIAFVHSGGPMAHMAQTLLDLLTKDTERRMFNHDQYDDAVDWLLSV